MNLAALTIVVTLAATTAPEAPPGAAPPSAATTGAVQPEPPAATAPQASTVQAGAPAAADATAAPARPAEAPRPEPKAASGFTFSLHGFVSATAYVQDANLGFYPGQGAAWVNAQTSVPQPGTDKLLLDGDVRQSRFNLAAAGPSVLNARPRGVLEFDFAGGFTGGNYGDASLLPRLRLVYLEADWGQHRIVAGQAHDLTFAVVPVSLSHVGGASLGSGAGGVGWRRPSVSGYHRLGSRAGTNVEVAWLVGRSNWANSGKVAGSTADVNGTGQQTIGAGGDAYGISLGAASGLPAVQARVTVAHASSLSAFVAGHWSSVDRSGVGAHSSAATDNSDLKVVAATAGAKATLGPLTLLASGYAGKNLAPIGGAFLQFQPNAAGDVRELGGFAQVGVNVTSRLALWAFGGFAKVNELDGVEARFSRLRNVNTTGSVIWRDPSGLALSAEWIHLRTLTRVYPSATVTDSAAAAASGELRGNQWNLTANYYF